MRSTSALIAIDDVVIPGFPTALLRAAHLDRPVPGLLVEESAIDMIGWAVGRTAPVVAVELLQNGEARLRVPIHLGRPDVARTHPDVTYAEPSGFTLRWAVHGLGPFQVSLQAVLANQAREVFATIRGGRRWR